MTEKMLFLYNPKAGKTQIQTKLSEIIQIFSSAGYEITVYPTRKTMDATEKVAQDAKNYDLLAVSGGDGTLNEAVTGLMRSGCSIPIGYIPSGSTNDFADSLHLSRDMVRAARDIVRGKGFCCDIGKFNDRNFVYIAAFGLFTDISYETKQDMKNMLGHLAYILEGIKRISAIQSYHMKVTCGTKTIEDDFMYGMVTNSVSVGGFKRITGKYVKLDDGEFEVTLIKKPKNAKELNELMTALVNRDIDAERIYCFKASSVSFESPEKVAWTVDGEFGGRHNRVLIENQCKAVEILINGSKKEKNVK